MATTYISKINQLGGSDVYVIKDSEAIQSIATGDNNGQIKITPRSGDAYNISVKGLGTNAYTSTAYAPLASPTLTGTPKAPTAAAGTNTTQIATTAFVQAAITNATASSLNHTLTIGTYSFDGSEDVEIPVYNGAIS